MAMLTKKHRLPKKRIEQVKGGGRYFQTPFFTLVYLSGRRTASQFAFVLSKRVSKKATIRNKTKRLIAGSVREIMTDLKSGFWAVFLVKRAALDQGKEVLSEVVRDSFNKVGLLTEDEKADS
ncbi:MAG: ribonuclease P protein component [Candidatus Shapirobacteria bacterium]|nr:ribonuclease P protein component [Candidatus Shapirobacteria bacterium]MDD5073609.1 ribonuclease P protein component [Candidatus Shapirobacteria bacterium]MDD5481362.1 ribonuclease P protein component [Candidatus Shapirobacteria bacterium]